MAISCHAPRRSQPRGFFELFASWHSEKFRSQTISDDKTQPDEVQGHSV